MNGAASNVGCPHAATMKAPRAHAAAVKTSPTAKAATSTAACKCIIRNKAGRNEDRGRKADQTVSNHSILPGSEVPATAVFRIECSRQRHRRQSILFQHLAHLI
ncbi:hypothetical protein ABIA45_002560 [Bradyrhizobium sp. USDA 336]|uniref:hypothetical protein n=1 Tax=Bradyrhizobium sp. CCBAU 45321 TaxID=1641878 RepID=UPI0018E015BF